MSKTRIQPVQLMFPIETTDGRTIDTITFSRRLTAEDLIEVDHITGGNARSAHIIARINGDITPADVQKMDAADFLECSDRVQGFLEYRQPSSGSSPETSPSSSTGRQGKSTA